jgi:tRNA (guanine-N7-)-methyltransferase
MTPGRKVRWAAMFPRFGLDLDGLADWPPDALDVGFGNGVSVTHLAVLEPTWRIVGVDVHEAGIVQLFDVLEASAIENVRVVRDDIVEVLPRLADESLQRIQVFCPDPWPKAAQIHRRLVRADTVDEFVRLLRFDGILHLATDWFEYADVMREVCNRPDLEPVDPPSRAVTKYETKGHFEGRPMTDLAYRRVAISVR